MRADDTTTTLSVVHVIGRLNVGGAETMLLNLCRAMPATKFRQTVVSMAGERGSLSDEFRESGVTEVPCRLSPTPYFALRLVRVLRSAQADVLISHISLASAAILVIGALGGVPKRIAVFHSDGDGRSTSKLRAIYRVGMRTLLGLVATDVVGVTATTLAFSGILDSRAQVIPNAVDLTKKIPLDRDAAAEQLGLGGYTRVIAHIGRAAPEKNRHILPAIMGFLPGSYGLALAGADSLTDLNLEDGSPIASRIKNFGLVPRVDPILAAADVLVLPSIREGLPLVLLEALALGCPVVATDLPGIRSVAGSFPDIRLVSDPANAEGFARAIDAAITEKRTPEEMRNQLSATHLDLASVAERWVRLCVGTP